MPADFSELSSIASTLEQLTRRVSGMAEAAQGDKDEHAALELFAVERQLAAAERRLTRMLAAGR